METFGHKAIKLLFFLIFIAKQSFAQGRLDSIAKFDCQGCSLTTFIERVESESDIHFYYKDAWVNSVNIATATKNKSYKWIIDKAIANYGLTYIVFQDRSIIFIPKNFIVNDDLSDKGVDDIKVIGNIMEKGKYKQNKVEGIVRAGKDDEPIVGAVVLDKAHNLATTTNYEGYYSLMMPAGRTELEFSFIGLETEYVKVDVLSPGKLDVSLMETSIALEGVTVTAIGGKNQVNRTQMGVEAIDMLTMKKLPVLMGEADIVRSMTLMPGVQTMGEMSSGFNVRGGNVDQNLILLNEAPVYNTSHMFGMFSTFLPNAIGGVELYKSSQPAEFGNRVASVMDIRLKNADTTKFHGNAGIGILNGHLFIETPINKMCSFYIGGRATYSNWILKKTHNVNINQSKANFNDLIAKVDFRLNRKHNLEIFGYRGYDFFHYNKLNEYDYTSQMAGMNYRWIPAHDKQLKLSASYSNYDANLAEISQQSLANNIETSITHLRGKGEFIFGILNHNITFGVEANHLSINPGKQIALNSNSSVKPMEIDGENGLEFAGFLSDDYTISYALSVMAGIRYSWFSKVGECTENTYADDMPRSEKSILTSVSYKKGELVKPYQGIEPRIGLRYKINPISSIKMSYSLTRQYQQLISGSTSAMPTDYWKLADGNIKPLSCQQVSIGYFATVFNDKLDISAEFYYKTTQNQLDYKNGAKLTMNSAVEQSLLSGQARSYGMELMLRKNVGRFTGWISYTLSKTEMKVDGVLDDEKINDGKYYNASTHHLHDLSLTSSFQITRRWNASANFVLTSGRPVTLPEYNYTLQGMEIISYSDRNKYQLPAYHRLDLSVTYDGALNKRKKVHPSLTFALYNAYGHKNVYSIFYKKSKPTSYTSPNSNGLFKLAIIGVPIPSVTLNLNF